MILYWKHPAASSILGCVLAAMFTLADISVAEDRLEVGVRYRSQDTVYLDSGSLAGLAEGDRLEILRSGQRIGEVEVTFVAEHSASCRIIEESQQIQPEDRAQRLASGSTAGDVPPPESDGAETQTPPPVEPVSSSTGRRDYSSTRKPRRTRV